jgi:hypothetical protein
MRRIALASPRLKATIAVAFNLLVILVGVFAAFVFNGRSGFVALLIAAMGNIAATRLLYDILRPVNRSLALFAALVSPLHAGIVAVNTLHHFAWLVLLGDAHFFQHGAIASPGARVF